MSTPFFNTPDRIAKLQFYAGTWIGTPFMPNAAFKGSGVSCQKLVGSILVECGALPKDFAIPEGPMDWAGAHKDSIIAQFLDEHPEHFTVVENKFAPQPGDLIGLKIGGCVHHLGLMLAAEGTFIHCLRNNGTTTNNIHDASYWIRIGQVWRPVTQ
jgi:cell wall-associated NlpC family hydrolase